MRLVPLMEEASIASLKSTVTTLFTATFTAPQSGIEAVGGDTLQLVQSEQAAMKSRNGKPTNKHNHFVNALHLHMDFILEA
jgi:hypothetical protein